LIIVCDRHGFVDDLTKHLYHHNLLRYLEVYIQKVNPNQAPTVVGSLLDVDCNEDYIRNLIKMLGKDVPVSELIEACEQRNRLKILLPWLEELVHAGSVEPAAHNALAKIYIDMNRDAERFLLTNQYYDSREVGKFCEGRDPHLACVVYRRGLCDKELIDVTNRNELWRNQARYLLERQSEDLWLTVLDESNPHRRNIIDQVVQSSIPECNNPDEVSCTVQSFMHAGLPLELIGLLEKIVLETNSRFGNNRNLQNLLILTAVKANTAKVMEYINRLDNFDAPEIASIAIGAELYEEAFVVYKKFKHNSQAIQVLIDHLNDVHRANDFANLVNEPEVYSKLARAQLDRKLVKEAIDSFIKASDHQYYLDVIRAAEESDLYQDLTRFLLMCRKMGKDPHVETELAWAYAKTNSLRELNEFISTPNCAQIQVVGDRCFNAGLYQAAKLLFNNISNFARLASTLVKLEDYSAGVEAARKANNIRTWKEVCAACVDAQQFRLAQICGLHIIIHSEELDELIRYYEERGHFEELMGLIEAGLNLERAHIGMFTELAILFSKYKPEKLMDHLRLFYNRMNISKVLKICEKNHQWPELTFLYIHYKEPDNAALTMINHSVEAWEHILFKEILPKVTSVEILYRSIQFYFEEHPTLVNDLLTVVIGRVDHSRVVSLARGPGPNDYLPLIKPYLLSVQPENTKAVNNSVNQLYIEEEDYENLRTSIDTFSNFDNLELAQTLERNNSVEFRRIAAYLYKKNKRWEQSIELSKRDHLWKDAIDCAAESANSKLIEQLLRFFVAEGRKDCFAACTYTCYNYIRPDIVLEVAWTNGMIDFAMPFLIQTMKDFSSKLADLDSKVNPPPPQMDPNAVPGSPQNFGQPVGK
jgi:clathrin heavy chain